MPEEGWDQKGLAALNGASTGSVGTALEAGGGGRASGSGWKGPVKGVPVTNGCCCACMLKEIASSFEAAAGRAL